MKMGLDPKQSIDGTINAYADLVRRVNSEEELGRVKTQLEQRYQNATGNAEDRSRLDDVYRTAVKIIQKRSEELILTDLIASGKEQIRNVYREIVNVQPINLNVLLERSSDVKAHGGKMEGMDPELKSEYDSFFKTIRRTYEEGIDALRKRAKGSDLSEISSYAVPELLKIELYETWWENHPDANGEEFIGVVSQRLNALESGTEGYEIIQRQYSKLMGSAIAPEPTFETECPTTQPRFETGDFHDESMLDTISNGGGEINKFAAGGTARRTKPMFKIPPPEKGPLDGWAKEATKPKVLAALDAVVLESEEYENNISGEDAPPLKELGDEFSKANVEEFLKSANFDYQSPIAEVAVGVREESEAGFFPSMFQDDFYEEETSVSQDKLIANFKDVYRETVEKIITASLERRNFFDSENIENLANNYKAYTKDDLPPIAYLLRIVNEQEKVAGEVYYETVVENIQQLVAAYDHKLTEGEIQVLQSLETRFVQELGNKENEEYIAEENLKGIVGELIGKEVSFEQVKEETTVEVAQREDLWDVEIDLEANSSVEPDSYPTPEEITTIVTEPEEEDDFPDGPGVYHLKKEEITKPTTVVNVSEEVSFISDDDIPMDVEEFDEDYLDDIYESVYANNGDTIEQLTPPITYLKNDDDDDDEPTTLIFERFDLDTYFSEIQEREAPVINEEEPPIILEELVEEAEPIEEVVAEEDESTIESLFAQEITSLRERVDRKRLHYHLSLSQNQKLGDLLEQAFSYDSKTEEKRNPLATLAEELNNDYGYNNLTEEKRAALAEMLTDYNKENHDLTKFEKRFVGMISEWYSQEDDSETITDLNEFFGGEPIHRVESKGYEELKQDLFKRVDRKILNYDLSLSQNQSVKDLLKQTFSYNPKTDGKRNPLATLAEELNKDYRYNNLTKEKCVSLAEKLTDYNKENHDLTKNEKDFLSWMSDYYSQEDNLETIADLKGFMEGDTSLPVDIREYEKPESREYSLFERTVATATAASLCLTSIISPLDPLSLDYKKDLGATTLVESQLDVEDEPATIQNDPMYKDLIIEPIVQPADEYSVTNDLGDVLTETGVVIERKGEDFTLPTEETDARDDLKEELPEPISNVIEFSELDNISSQVVSSLENIVGSIRAKEELQKETQAQTEIIPYVVREGDTLSGISWTFRQGHWPNLFELEQNAHLLEKGYDENPRNLQIGETVYVEVESTHPVTVDHKKDYMIGEIEKHCGEEDKWANVRATEIYNNKKATELPLGKGYDSVCLKKGESLEQKVEPKKKSKGLLSKVKKGFSKVKFWGKKKKKY